MRKIALLLVLLTLLSLLSVLPASADSFYSVSVTDSKSDALTDPSVRNYWKPASADSKVTITLKNGAVTDGIYISWYTEESVFTLTAYDSHGNIVTVCKNGDKYDGYSCFYPLDEATRRVEIAMPANPAEKDYGIVYLELSEKGKDSPGLMKWENPASSCDLLVAATHQDDEFIFMGGVIPKYLDAGYSVALAYTSVCGRLRVEEGLRGVWASGIRSYPDFIGYPDMGRKETFDEAAGVWGGLDAVVKSYVRELRMRKPVVVVTHDENGENYHNSHKVTAAALKQAVVSAADPSYDPESAEKYGVWQVSKLYLHLYRKNQIRLNYSTPLPRYGGKTAYEAAMAAYDCHPSQHAWYMLDWAAIQPGAKYDNRLFGCYYSAVGYDDVDLFCNTPVYRGGANPPDPPPEPPATTGPAWTDPPPATAAPPASASDTVRTDPPATSGPVKTDPVPAGTAGTTTDAPFTGSSAPRSTGTSPAAAPSTGPGTGTSAPPSAGTPALTTAGTTLPPISESAGNDRSILPMLVGFGAAAAAVIAGVIIVLVLRRRK